MMPMSSTSSLNSQKGAALVVSLVILAVMSIIGVASMQRSSLELKMVSSTHDRNVAFEAAEATLIAIEKNLQADPPNFHQLYTECTGTGCFNNRCDGGLCFAGVFSADTEKGQCYVADPTNNRSSDFWEDSTLAVWDNSAKHQVFDVSNVNNPVKYIIEFLCFIDLRPQFGSGYTASVGDNDISENENYAPLYRITALATGNANRATVVLQSTYRLIEGS